ncbi:MAG: hypothetical protein P4K93_15550 [Terracidiphilus sp.]|nr:hypothetical protein [Terracidiphilus sp.]MDR3799574.1 hypothetical protein [Terracidiphilus sp.]
MKNHSQSLSRPASISFLMLTLVLGVAWVAPHNNQFAAAAQSANAGSCATVPDGNITQAQIAQFESVEAGLKDQLAQANHDYEIARLRCKVDPTPGGCMDRAQKLFQNAEITVQKRRDENDANRQKAEIDAGAARDQCDVTGETAAEKQENLRHFQVLIALKKKTVDVQTNYTLAKLDCQMYTTSAPPAQSGGAPSSDKRPDGEFYPLAKPAGCVSEAEKEYKAAQVNLQVDSNEEDFLHTKNLKTMQK